MCAILECFWFLDNHLETKQWHIVPDDCFPPSISPPTNPLSNTMGYVARHRKYTQNITLLTFHNPPDKFKKAHTTQWTLTYMFYSRNSTHHKQDTNIYTLQETLYTLNTSSVSITLPVHTTNNYYWELMGYNE